VQDAYMRIMEMMTKPEMRKSDNKIQVPELKEDETVRDEIIFREYLHGRDSGNPWSDPYNDIDKRGNIEITIKKGTDDEQNHTDGFFWPDGPFYGLCKSYTNYVRLYESLLPSKKEIPNIVAFEYNDHVFNNVYV